jgi:hypothetical protein
VLRLIVPIVGTVLILWLPTAGAVLSVLRPESTFGSPRERIVLAIWWIERAALVAGVWVATFLRSLWVLASLVGVVVVTFAARRRLGQDFPV